MYGVSDQLLTVQRLKEVLHYDADTGLFTRFAGRGRWKERAGTINRGYLTIIVDQKRYRAHRLAWLYVHGEWPNDEIDHINGERADNRISNLRVATRTQNLHNISKANRNSKSGLRGTMWISSTNKWRAAIVVEGKFKHLGMFDEAEQAHAVYVEAKRILHPFCTI